MQEITPTEILKGHTSPESALVINDYPYGFHLRCKIRYWLETHTKRGVRFISQTTNPKRPGEVWNKPKASTYCRFAGCMYLDEDGHVQWTGAHEYMDLEQLDKWVATFGDGVPEAAQEILKRWVKMKTTYEEGKRNGTIQPIQIVSEEVFDIGESGHLEKEEAVKV